MNDLYKSFETWWSSDKSQFTEDDELKQFAWSIWQASRAAVEVAIPDRIANINLRSPLEVEDMWRDRMALSICSAGIKVKE